MDELLYKVLYIIKLKTKLMIVSGVIEDIQKCKRFLAFICTI